MNFGPQTTELKWLILTNPSGHFSGDYISAIRGCCSVKFLHALEIDPGYLAHAPTGTGVPKKILIVKILKFGLKFSVWATITLALSSRNFFQPTCRRVGVITRVQFSEGPPPTISEVETTSKIRRNVWQLSTLIAIILGTDHHVESRKIPFSTTTPSTLGRRNLVNFGPQTTELKWLILTNPSGHFSGDYISAIRGCCPLKFLLALEIDSGYLAHTPTGTPPPEKN